MNLPDQDVAEMVVFEHFESGGETIEFGMEEVDFDIGELPEGVTTVEYEGDGRVYIEGETMSVKVVGYIPAGGGPPGEPPINPPEYITEDVKIHWTLMGFISGYYFGESTLEIEAW